MQPRIDNDVALTHAISVDLRMAVEAFADSIVELIRGFVKAEVYDAYDPVRYSRQSNPEADSGAGFYHSWMFTDIETKAGSLGSGRQFTTKIFSNPDLMSFFPREYVHGSGGISTDIGGGFEPIVTNITDRRPNLDKYIAEGTDYDFPYEEYNPPYAEPRDYWTPVMDLMNIGMFGDMFMQSFKSLGARIKKK